MSKGYSVTLSQDFRKVEIVNWYGHVIAYRDLPVWSTEWTKREEVLSQCPENLAVWQEVWEFVYRTEE